MANLLQSFVFTFIPLFIVVDALGTLPFVLSLSEDMTRPQRRHMIHLAAITASIVGLFFLFLGQIILKLMGISVGSFTGHMVEAIKEELVAVVPIGTPLTVGPATITTLLLLATQFPIYMVLISFALNMAITWVIFLGGGQVSRFLGRGGLKAISRVFSLLLGAIAVNMVIHGLELVGIIKIAGG
jgi:multiple antibiotic resistance protein